jgi:hypothetical protein
VIVGYWVEGLTDYLGFFEAMGRQPAMRFFYANMFTPPDREMSKVLARFPNLRELALMDRYSGAGFPTLAQLEWVDLREGLTDEGLAAILRCPKLASLSISETKVSKAAFMEIPQRRPKTLKKLEIGLPGLKPGEDKKLTAWLKAKCPDLECEVYGTRDEVASGGAAGQE